jgi:hypothetical protein
LIIITIANGVHPQVDTLEQDIMTHTLIFLIIVTQKTGVFKHEHVRFCVDITGALHDLSFKRYDSWGSVSFGLISRTLGHAKIENIVYLEAFSIPACVSVHLSNFVALLTFYAALSTGVLPAVKGSTAKILALSLVALRIQLCLLPLLSTCPRVALVAVAPYLVKTPSNGRWSKCPLISPLIHSIPLPPPNFELTLLLPAYSLILVIMEVDSVHNVLSNERRGTLMLHVYLFQHVKGSSWP